MPGAGTIRRLTVLVCGFVLATSALGQIIKGTVTGVVEDPTGARVPNAMIEAVNQDTNVHYPSSITAAGLVILSRSATGPVCDHGGGERVQENCENGAGRGGEPVAGLDLKLETWGPRPIRSRYRAQRHWWNRTARPSAEASRRRSSTRCLSAAIR